MIPKIAKSPRANPICSMTFSRRKHNKKTMLEIRMYVKRKSFLLEVEKYNHLTRIIITMRFKEKRPINSSRFDKSTISIPANLVLSIAI
jgi:hypothetical protein